MADDMQVSCTLAGIDLDGGRDVNGYELHADTRSQVQYTWRKQTVENTFVEGSYDVRAVRGNVTEQIAVWVYGTSPSDFERKVQVIASAIARSSFPVVWGKTGMTETWDCTYSDYTLETQREFQHATMGIVRIALQRRPRVTRVYSDATTFVG